MSQNQQAENDSLLAHSKASDTSAMKRSVEGHFADLLADLQYFAEMHRERGSNEECLKLERCVSEIRESRSKISGCLH